MLIDCNSCQLKKKKNIGDFETDVLEKYLMYLSQDEQIHAMIITITKDIWNVLTYNSNVIPSPPPNICFGNMTIILFQENA